MIVGLQSQTLLKRIHTSDLVAAILVAYAASFAPQTLDAHTCIPSIRHQIVRIRIESFKAKHDRLLGFVLRFQRPDVQHLVTHLLQPEEEPRQSQPRFHSIGMCLVVMYNFMGCPTSDRFFVSL